MHLVYRFRVKNLEGQLNAWARVVNFVWNYCNDVQQHAVKWGKRWPTGFDLVRMVTGTSETLGLSANSINDTCRQFAVSRTQAKKRRLRYRGRKNLGWIPVKGCDIKRKGDAFRFHGKTFRVFNPREIPGTLCDRSSFSQDAKGNWYLNLVVEISESAVRAPVRAVGIDLGLKDFAALSTGEKVENKHHYASVEKRLAVAQRAKRKRQARNIHAKIANRRRDMLHKLSNRLTKEFDFIAVGNVNAKALSQTGMAKSVQDVSWSSFRDMLRYKSIRNGATFVEVSERFTSQVCSGCGSLPDSRPNGIADLGVRHWVCSDCGASHDRDVNAALNILARAGHRSPVVEIAA